MQESEVKYRSLFNSGPNPIFVLDRDQCRILDANPKAKAVFGYTQEELNATPFRDLGPIEVTARSNTKGKKGVWSSPRPSI